MKHWPFSGALYSLPPDWEHNCKRQSWEWQNHQTVAIRHIKMQLCICHPNCIKGRSCNWRWFARRTITVNRHVILLWLGEINGNQISGTSSHISVGVAEYCFDNCPNILQQDSWDSSNIVDVTQGLVLLVQWKFWSSGWLMWKKYVIISIWLVFTRKSALIVRCRNLL